MTSPLLQPALAFNFTVTMWDVQGPGVFGVDETASAALGAVASVATGPIFASFSEVTGLESSVETETYAEGGRNEQVHKFIKGVKFPNLTFKRGVTARPDLWEWHAQVVSGSDTVIRKSGLIILFDRNGPGASAPGLGGLTRVPIAAWMFERGIPEKLQGPPLDAKSNSIAIEVLEISHQRLQRVSLGAIPGLGDIAASITAVF